MIGRSAWWRYGVIVLNRQAGSRNRLRAAADAGGDRLLGGGMLLPDALRRCLDVVRGFERLYLLGDFGNARSLLVVRLISRTGKARFELVTQTGQF